MEQTLKGFRQSVQKRYKEIGKSRSGKLKLEINSAEQEAPFSPETTFHQAGQFTYLTASETKAVLQTFMSRAEEKWISEAGIIRQTKLGVTGDNRIEGKLKKFVSTWGDLINKKFTLKIVKGCLIKFRNK